MRHVYFRGIIGLVWLAAAIVSGIIRTLLSAFHIG